MKLIKVCLSAMMVMFPLLLTPASAHAGGECTSTAWQKSNGRTCANTGLNTHKAVCTGGAYAVYCDDTKTRIRTCLSKVACNAQPGLPTFTPQVFNNGFQYPKFGYQPQNTYQPARPNKGNNYEIFHGKRFHCTDWNYNKKRPCKRDRFNEDCRGSCS